MRKFLFCFLLAISNFSLAITSTNKEDIRKAIKKHLPEIKECANHAIGHQPSGKIVVDFDVNDQGAVTRSDFILEKTTLRDLIVQQCITHKISVWTFPKAAKGQIVNVQYPIVFNQ